MDDQNLNHETSATQCKQILTHLKNGGDITPLDALSMFGCFRLAARINDLGKEGHIIKREMVFDAGTGKRHARYWMDAQ